MILNKMSDLCNVPFYFIKKISLQGVLDDLKKPISVDIYPAIPFWTCDFLPCNPNSDKQQVYSPVHQCSFNCLFTEDPVPIEGI